MQPRSPPPQSTTSTSTTSKPSPRDFSHLLKPDLFHSISPLNQPPPFRSSPSRHFSPETPIPDLLAAGQFRIAAVAAAQALTSAPVSATVAAANPPVVDPRDAPRIFGLFYVRLACLCLIDATPLAAQEAKVLVEDLHYSPPSEEGTDLHSVIVPWELRVLAVRLQALGFGDPRRAVMSYYELAREARYEVARFDIAAASGVSDGTAKEVWEARLADLGLRVACALIEMGDLAGAAEHLGTLGNGGLVENEDEGDQGKDTKGRLDMSRALLWLHLGDAEAARRCFADDEAHGKMGGKVVAALADMADGEFETAMKKWEDLQRELEEKGVKDEMVSANSAVCLLYLGKMTEGRNRLENLVEAGRASSTLLFNLSTMYELCTDQAKLLKMKLAERVAGMPPSAQGWEKTNADFKL